MAAQHVASATWAYATAVKSPGGSGAVRKGTAQRAAGVRQAAGPEAGRAAAEALQQQSASLLVAVARGLGSGVRGAGRRRRRGTESDTWGRQRAGQQGGHVSRGRVEEGQEEEEGEDELLAARLAGGEGRRAQVGGLGAVCVEGREFSWDVGGLRPFGILPPKPHRLTKAHVTPYRCTPTCTMHTLAVPLSGVQSYGHGPLL